MKISEWEFLKLLFNSEEKLVKRANKREKDARQSAISRKWKMHSGGVLNAYSGWGDSVQRKL